MTTDCIKDYIERNLSEKRKIHTYAVRDIACKLAVYYGEDVHKAETAALFHDMFRSIPVQLLNAYVKAFSLPEGYIDNPNLAHGKIAAIVMQRDFGIEDETIINAVKYHTTGRFGMSKLEKILYLADAIEPNRNYPGADELRSMAFDGLDKACLACLVHSRAYIIEKGLFLDQDTELAIEDLKTERKQADEQ